MVKSVAVVGDVMWDQYIYVETRREAAEAPIPVWDEIHREGRLGGAANVAMNVQLMEPELDVHLVGISDLCFGSAMTKTRYVYNNRIIFRHDDALRYDEVDAQLLLESVRRDHPVDRVYDAVVFSDYDKGTITQDLYDFFARRTRLVVIDSKRRDLSMFSDKNRTTVLKVNEMEWAAQASNEVPVEAMFDYVVVTKGKDGSQLRQYDPKESKLGRSVIHSEDFPTKRVWAVDVTGCGDTHTAAMAVSLLRERDMRQAVRFGNEKASLAVQEFGTVAVR